MDLEAKILSGKFFESLDIDREPLREIDPDDSIHFRAQDAASADPDAVPLPDVPLTAKQQRRVYDQFERHELGIGEAFTGVKGVLEDRKYHSKQERERYQEEQYQTFQKISQKALRSGWMEREIAREEAEKFGSNKTVPRVAQAAEEDSEEDEADELIQALEDELEETNGIASAYRQERLAQLSKLAEDRLFSYKKKFGTLIDLKLDDFLACIDQEDPDVLVVIHFYQPHLETCKTLNTILSFLAKKYSTVKFAKIVSTEADESFDPITLPALLCYHGGQLVQTLLRISDEIPHFTKTGRCEVDDMEGFLLHKKILNEQDIAPGY